MSGSKILWLQVFTVFGIVIAAIWSATEWTAWQLAFQPELGAPWCVAAGLPMYLPPAFFWWWFAYDAYAPEVFLHGAYIVAAGTLVAIVAAIAMSVWQAREAQNVITYGSARWAQPDEVHAAGLLASDGVLLGKLGRDYLRHDGPEHVPPPARAKVSAWWCPPC
jgi:type IV secretion system protein VirD4